MILTDLSSLMNISVLHWRFRGMQQSHYELKLYLKCKCTEHKAKHQSLVRNVAYQQLKRGQIRRSYFVIRAEWS